MPSEPGRSTKDGLFPGRLALADAIYRAIDEADAEKRAFRNGVCGLVVLYACLGFQAWFSRNSSEVIPLDTLFSFLSSVTSVRSSLRDAYRYDASYADMLLFKESLNTCSSSTSILGMALAALRQFVRSFVASSCLSVFNNAHSFQMAFVNS